MSCTINRVKEELQRIIKDNHPDLHILKKLQEVYDMLNNPDLGFVEWGTEDLHTQAKYYGMYLSEEDAQQALKDMIQHHDCNYGITWDTINSYLDDYAKPITKMICNECGYDPSFKEATNNEDDFPHCPSCGSDDLDPVKE